MHIKDLIPALLIAIAAHTSAADDLTINCMRDGNQQEMNTCAARHYRAADAALNIKYGEVMAKLPVTEQATLRREQRAWLKHRDPQCNAKARPSEGGSLWPLAYLSCMQASTEKRTQELGRR